MIKKKNKPKFCVMNTGLRIKVRNRDRWRKPRADSNKKKMKYRFAGKSPRIGYKNLPEVRGLHPCGLPEALVANVAELSTLSGCIVRIRSAVSRRKALEIVKAAKAKGLKIANPRKALENAPSAVASEGLKSTETAKSGGTIKSAGAVKSGEGVKAGVSK